MSKSTRGIRVAGIASLAVSLSVGVAAPALAAPGFEFTRVKGDDRYGTAVAAAEIYGASDDVILANGQPGEYADALAGNYLAGAEDAPILLTKRSGIPDVTKAQIDDIDPAKIWVVGGTAAVPAEQVAQLEADGYDVERVSGSDRFGTNAKVIEADGPSKDGIGLIATGLNFPDALAAGPFAYQGHSLGLVRTDSVPDVVGDALQADGVTKVLIFGGTGAVGQGVVDDLAARGITVEERFAGSDRSDTSEKAAEWALENLDFTDEHVGVASGYTDGFGADALAGGPVEGNEMSPMLITRNVDNPGDVLDYLEAHSDSLTDGHIYGGTAAISQSAEDAMEEAAQGTEAPSNQDYNVAPAGNQTDETGGADFDYTITGIPAGVNSVDISLLACEDVTVSNTGRAVFEDDENTSGDTSVLEGDNQADGVNEEDTPAYFTSRNGTAVEGTTTEHLNDVAVINGSVTFSVNSAEIDCVRAVVFNDANNDHELNLDANNEPTEDFALTGELQFTAPAAGTGAMDENVASVDKANNRFVGCELTNTDGATGTAPNQGAGDGTDAVDSADCDTFSYDATDRFYIDGNDDRVGDSGEQATLAQFEAALSTGDDVAGDYNANPELQSTFILYNEAPTQPGVTSDLTPGAETTSVTLTITEPSSGRPDSYNVYRYTGDCDDADFDATPNDYTQIGTVTPEEDGTTTYTASGLTANTKYCFVVTAVEDGDESDPSAETEETTGTTNTTDTVRPESVDAELTTNTNFETRLDSGDVLQACFDEVLKAPDAGDAVVVRDNDGDIATLTNGGNATFTIGSSTAVGNDDDLAVESCPANQALIITITGAVTDSGTNGDGIVNVPVTATDSSGVTDVAGNAWNIADSADKYFDTANAVTGADAEEAPPAA